jgi:peptide/nickel transport system permease protein
MVAFIVRRLFIGVIILLLVTILVFLVMRLLPGDPLTLYLAQSQVQTLSPDQVAQLKHEFGLDQSLPMQYINWIGGVLHGNLGLSIIFKLDVSYMIKTALPITLYLGVISFVISAILGILFGVICALRRGKWIDTFVTVLANIGITVPSFWVGILLMYLLSLQLHLLPTSGFTSPFDDFGMSIKQIIMPVMCLALFPIASLARQTRSSMLEVVSQDYIRTAWAKGLRERIIIMRHTIKNAMIPVVTILGLQVSLLFGGAVLVETVFNIPGMGRLMADALFSHDYQVVQAGVLIIALVITVVNLLVDISYGWFDPRIRYS